VSSLGIGSVGAVIGTLHPDPVVPAAVVVVHLLVVADAVVDLL
jgi:hypothetical protein